MGLGKSHIVFILSLAVFLVLPSYVFAVDESPDKKIEELSKELEQLKKDLEKQKKDGTGLKKDIKAVERVVKKVEPWGRFDLKGDFRFKIDSVHAKFNDFIGFRWNPNVMWMSGTTPLGLLGAYQPKAYDGFNADNDFINTNRLRLSMKAKATEDIDFVGRIAMYKIWGQETAAPLGTPIWTGGSWDSLQAQNDMMFDGNRTHRPSDSALRVDRAYFDWVQPLGFKDGWLSIGRRASTGGPPLHLREGMGFSEKGGTPSGLVFDMAFDGALLGYAPTEGFPQGFIARLCYGKGFESGLDVKENALSDDSQFAGFNIDLYNTPNTFINLMAARVFNIPDIPEKATADIGDVNGGALVIMKKSPHIEWFGSVGVTRTEPRDLSNWRFPVDGDGTGTFGDSAYDAMASPGGLLTDEGGEKEDRTGWGAYAGIRVPFGEKNKIGLEYNYGSKYWIPLTQGADDIYGSKVATRGHVGEAYWIYDITKAPVTELSKAFLKLSYQHYEFEYSGSGLMLGEPKKLSDNPMMLFPSPEKMDNLLLSFNIYF